MKHKVQLCCIIVVLCCLRLPSYAQVFASSRTVMEDPSPVQHSIKPLKSALYDVENRFQVSIAYKSGLIENKKVEVKKESYATVEEALSSLLKSCNLTYKKSGQNLYTIVSNSKQGETYLAKIENKPLGAEASTSLTNEDALSFERVKQQVSLRNIAQAVTITGRVTDDKGEGLPGVNVLVKGTTIGNTTDIDGRYTLNAPDGNGTLQFSFIGYVTQEVAISNRTNIDMTLVPDIQSLSEVVVVGYGEQKKVTVTGSVATVKGDELKKSPAVNLSNSIAGRMPGVIAMNGSGEPGYDGSTIRIRGSNTLGNNDALIVIDGVPARAGGFERLNPADIESISVLKDASAAIYGSRAANGVILITTKRGKTGKPELSYSFNQGWAQPTIVPKMATAAQYAEMVNEIDIYNLPSEYWGAAAEAFKTTGSFTRPDNGAVTNATFKPDDMQKFRDGSDPWGHPNTDWFDAALKPWSPQSRHNLQLAGGSENVKYLTSLGYQNQDAYYRNSATGYKQYDLRLNLDAKVNKYINTSLGIVGRQESRFFPTRSAGSIFRMLMRGYPYRPAYWPNGLPGPDIENGEQPVVISTSNTGYDRDNRYYLQTNGKVEISIPGAEGLKVTGSAAVDKFLRQTKNFQTPWYVYTWNGFEADGTTPIMSKVKRGPDQATLGQGTEDQTNILLSGIISYERTIAEHAITVLAGVTKETANSNFFGANRRYFNSTAIDQLFAGSEREMSNGGSAWERARLSYFGRLGYNFKEKYIAEFLWRYDGSYIFPKVSRFGFFPGVSAGWRISEEAFFKNNISFINNLKIRASWGQLGNDNVTFDGRFREYDYLATYGFGSYPIGGQVAQTLWEGVVPNPDFTWEVANNSNLGLEGQLLDGKIFFEFDVFSNRRSNILWNTRGSTPEHTGFIGKLPPKNIGKVANRGWEFRLGYNNQIGDFQYNVSVNGGYAKNEITFWDEAPGAPEWQRSTGHPMNTGTYYIYDGIFATQADIDANTLDYSGVGASTLRPGDMKYKDYNGDGKINGDDAVRRDKNNQPTFQGGLNLGAQWKGFDLAILFQGAAGGEIFLQTESGTIGNFLAYSYENRWTLDNPSTEHPRTVDRSNQYFSNGNTYWLRSTDYIRLKNFEIGYTLPVNLGQKVGVNNVRVYVNGLNLLTWDKTDVFDPESTNGNAQYYPQARIINTGLTVTF